MNLERIDIHSHYYPAEHLKLVSTRTDEIYAKGSKFPVMEKMYNLEMRFKEMRAAKVDRQVISVGPPGVDRLDRQTAIEEARKCNDEIARVVQKYNDRLDGMAILPLQDIEESLLELERATSDLGLKGVMINSNINWKPLDSPEFFPLYDMASKIGIPIHIHPTVPVCTDLQNEYALFTVVGFLFDSSLAVMRLILSGILDKFPNTKFIISHLGSLLPYIKQRLDDQWESFPPPLRGAITVAPSNYLKRFYVDTVNNYPPAYAIAKEIFGSERILFGTDYPFLDSSGGSNCVENLDYSEQEKRRVFSENARKLFNL